MILSKGRLRGLKTVAGILPTLVGLMAAVGVLRTSGFLDFLSGVLAGPAAFLHIPKTGSTASGASGVQFGGDGAALRYF